MRYLKVFWKHNFEDEPIELYSELDESGWETRKVEVFRSGLLGYASAFATTRGTALGLVPVPSIADISTDPQFEQHEISETEFEAAWLKATAGPHGQVPARPHP